MPSIQEHLDSPQFTDENGETTGETVLRVGGSWVKSGTPRRKGYLFYAIISIFGTGFILTSLASGSGFDLFAFLGVVCVGLGIAGGVETWRGRPFTKIFGG